MTEYGLLWVLWSRGLRHRRPGAAAAIAVLYAVSDEYHQTFVAGRHGSPIDVLIDGAGVAIAWALVRRRAARRPGTA